VTGLFLAWQAAHDDVRSWSTILRFLSTRRQSDTRFVVVVLVRIPLDWGLSGHFASLVCLFGNIRSEKLEGVRLAGGETAEKSLDEDAREILFLIFSFFVVFGSFCF